MKVTKKDVEVELRADVFTEHPVSEIFEEFPSSENPFLSESLLVQGYDLIELIDKADPVEMLFLQLRGELPSPENKKLLKMLWLFVSSLGPRFSGSRVAANAAISRASSSHIVPIGLLGASGEYGGSAEVENGFTDFSLIAKASGIRSFVIETNAKLEAIPLDLKECILMDVRIDKNIVPTILDRMKSLGTS